MDPIVLAICWLTGSVVLSLMGWVKSSEPWNTRKFLTSALSGVAAALGFGIQYKLQGAQLGIADCLTAFLAGMGIAAGVPFAIGAALSSKGITNNVSNTDSKKAS